MRKCQCGATMKWIRTGEHYLPDGTVIEQGYWKCLKCGATA